VSAGKRIVVQLVMGVEEDVNKDRDYLETVAKL